MRTLQVPTGVTSLSHGDQQFFPDDQGLVHVPDDVAAFFTRPPHQLVDVSGEPVQQPLPFSQDGIAFPEGVELVLTADLTPEADVSPTSEEEA